MSAKSIETLEEDAYDPINEEFLNIAFRKRDEAPKNPELNKLEKDRQVTIIIGPSGAGKSTLTCWLENSLLSAKRDKTRWHFFRDPMSKVIIGNTSNSCTELPTRIVGADGKTVYIDFPGFFDRDQAKEIACSFYLKTLIERTETFRIILTINYYMFQDKSQPLIELLDYMQGLFPEIDLLLKALFVVVTKVPSDEEITPITISEIAQEFLDQTKGLNPKTHSILKWLANPRQSDRVELFRQPCKHGEIDKSILQNIEAKLENVPFIQKSAIELYVPAKTEYYILKLIGRLQEKMNDEITKMIQKIEEICQRKISVSSFQELKQFISSVEDHIRVNDEDYQKNKDINNLLRLLYRYAKKINTHCLNPIECLDLETLKKTRISMVRLREIRPTTEFNVTTWQLQFRALKDRIRKITHVDCTEEAKGILQIKGIVINAKKLEPLLREGLKSIEIYCASAIFLDKVNIHCKGTSIAIIAPIWKVNGTNLIDISGKDGLPFSQRKGYHFDGNPGNPGGSAGNFLGISDKYVWNDNGELRIIANGGKGGPGEDGLDEWEKLENMMEELDQNRPIAEIKKPERPISLESRPLIRSRGGRGGCGGLGGNPGYVNITNEKKNELRIISQKKSGDIGENGDPGEKTRRRGEHSGPKDPTKNRKTGCLMFHCSGGDDSQPISRNVRPNKKGSVTNIPTETNRNSYQLSVSTDEINTENMIKPNPNFQFNESVKETYKDYFDQLVKEEGFQAIIGQNPFLIDIYNI